MLPKNSLHIRFFSALLALSTAVAMSTGKAAEAADDGSTESMWMDHAASTKSAPAASPAAETPADSSQNTDTSRSADTAVTGAGSGLETAAPMCSLSDFKGSALISKGGWPGVGPFKADGNSNEFVDDKQNKVRLDLSSNQIMRAELTMAGKQLSGNPQKDLLDMQMNIDFLMEAVGIKAKRIQDLNAELEKNKDSLLANDQNPLNMVTGRYSVNIEKHPAAQGSGTNYLVVVNSLDASKKIIKQHSLTEEPPKKSTPATTDAHYIFEDKNNKKVVQPDTTKQASRPVKPANAPTSGSIKEQFVAVIGDWQKIKKSAVRTRQTEELATILSGKALARQMDAVKWLVTNKKFYDMTPKGVIIDQYTELVPSRKYAVLAQVREAYKFIDEPTGHVVKEVDDTNKVNYTIEKVGGKWVITDSSLLSTNSTPGKTSANNKTTH